MTRVEHQWEFTKDLSRLIRFVESLGWMLTMGEGWRTPEQQKIYLETGKSKTMKSQHLERLAQDYNLFIPSESKDSITDWNKWKVLGDYWESLNPLNRWGGDFNKDNIKNGFIDCPHFERYI